MGSQLLGWIPLATRTVTKRKKQMGFGSTSEVSRPYIVLILLLCFILPFYFNIADFRLSGYRTALILLFVPAVVRWLDGSDRVRAVDLLLVCFAIWGSIAILANHGFAQYEYIGIRLIETLSPYFIARWLIRDASAFRAFSGWLFFVVVLMLPFSIHQSFTNRSIVLEFFDSFSEAYRTVQQEPRLGLYRAQGFLPHPILFGVFCSPAFALAWYVLGYDRSLVFKLPRVGLIGLVVFTSLSSGAWLSVMVQVALMLWNRVMAAIQAKWKLLLYMFAGMYIFIEIFSNRSPAQIFAAYLTIKKSTAWNRIHIFNNAIDDIMRNPIFGIGLNDWTRPRWMLASVDNFWLVMTMRYGLPAFLCLLAAVILLYRDIGRVTLTGKLACYRLGYLFALTGVCVAAISVHLWDAVYCLLMFMLGAGVWFVDAKDESVTEPVVAPSGPDRKIRYTRFGKDHDAPVARRRTKSQLGARDND
ncbi:O-antigen ligase family protein [Ruegeria sediminis]|uniref:O-antigen ligase family protein n=1 Tax=Ruegeria sediminis TaxID=2583820 RepID=A0ABY2WXM7_9RHOB|nr:O-antigen ligase family protein [Ruegeria sediminis]TMV07009.1 O-antigen ligase family protein [Ruegeria sediminis]